MGEETSQESTETTAGMSGTVTDVDGQVLPGVSIAAVHQPTGTTYQTISLGNGTWMLRNLRIGGPYTATASMVGFNSQTETDIYLKLGEDKTVDFQLSLKDV